MELQVTDLACDRGGVPVLEGVTFTLSAGAALILRGPNGSGKTTLLRTLAGLQPPLAGEVSMPGDTVAHAGHADGIKPTLTVSENLSFWAAIYGTRDIDPALDGFDLRAYRDRPAQNLSAGQKRRLGLARLAVTGRPLWMLDEPTVSLDAASVALFAAALQRHLGSGGAALIATHIDLGFEAEVLDVGQFKARAHSPAGAFDEAFE
ncbi:MAG: heme ABC exporter ATP-binding protein CcmA [Pseudomonadota bacterium]